MRVTRGILFFCMIGTAGSHPATVRLRTAVKEEGREEATLTNHERRKTQIAGGAREPMRGTKRVRQTGGTTRKTSRSTWQTVPSSTAARISTHATACNRAEHQRHRQLSACSLCPSLSADSFTASLVSP